MTWAPAWGTKSQTKLLIRHLAPFSRIAVKPMPPRSQLPYDEQSTDGIETLTELRTNEGVFDLRGFYEADLVQLVGYFNDGFCGWG